MKSLKVFYMGKPLRDVYPHATKWQVFKWKISEFLKKVIRFTFKLGLVGGSGYALFMAGAYLNPHEVTAFQEKIVTKIEAPVLDRIGGCESEGNRNAKPSQINPKTGQVRTHANNNGTTDIGAYQINLEVWGKKASELGYDLSQFEGNKAMAEWIYANKGTEDWYLSKTCWK